MNQDSNSAGQPTPIMQTANKDMPTFQAGAVPTVTDDIIKLQEKIEKQKKKCTSLDDEIEKVQAEILR